MKKNIAVLGDGGWGTTLAIYLAKAGQRVTLWGNFPQYVKQLDKKRINTKFLPGVKIPKEIIITSEIREAVRNNEIIILAIPSQFMRLALKKLKGINFSGKIILSVTKGIENKTLMRMSELIQSEIGSVKLASLSGPTIAGEVIKGVPTSAVIASHNKAIRDYLQDLFISDKFRIYTSSDLTGVELGGSLKNVIAIACGISDGLGFGANTKAAILARGLAEITRLGIKLGAHRETFSGLSGLGDLATTCISLHSRNRALGEQIGKGKPVRKVISQMQMVAEGVPTAKAVHQLSKKYKIDLPISSEVYNVLYKNKHPLKAVKDLMTRQKKEE